jgi:formate dehydrogenase subunit beta
MVETDSSVDFEPISSPITVKKNLVNTLNSFFKEILEKTEVEGIIVPNKLPSGKGYNPAMITSIDQINTINPLAPIMPVIISKAVSDYSRLTSSGNIIAVVLKPCEMRALIELVKLKQANIENLLLIGIDCPGTFSIQTFKGTDNEKNKAGVKVEKYETDSLLETFKKGKEHPEIRSACSACEHFAPGYADIVIGLYGIDITKNFLLIQNTPFGLETLEPLKLNLQSKSNKLQQARLDTIKKLIEKREEFIQKLITDTKKKIGGIDNFMTELASCINCHNCMTVCPICYCKECFFESPTFDLESEKYFKLAEQKGVMRLPANLFLFHLTRFNHMVLSCVACGMCEQGCPADIPLLKMYKTVGINAQKIFDYEPGRSLEEDIPILTFNEDELEPR